MLIGGVLIFGDIPSELLLLLQAIMINKDGTAFI